MLLGFQEFVRKHELIGENQKLLLAVSGGVDSVVLTDLVYKAGYSFAIAHVNFQLRGTASDEDEAFVRTLAEQYGVDFHSTRTDTRAEMTASGESIQICARRLRYDFFRRCMQANSYDLLLTAHHLNDSLETTLYHLAKGSGISGLKGVPVKNDYIVRPLLFAHKKQIVAYANNEKLVWREDSSNLKNDYSRNLIRNEIVPVLRQINPSLEETFVHTNNRLRAAYALFEDYIELLAGKAAMKVRGGVHIKKEVFLSEKNGAEYLAEFLKRYAFNYAQSLQIFQSEQSGARFLADKYTLINDRSHWIIIQRHKKDTISHLLDLSKPGELVTPSGNLRWRTIDTDALDIKNLKKSQLLIDVAKLAKPVLLRSVAQGDKFQPFGMSGNKLISDLLIDLKINVADKEKVLILTHGDIILWVVGIRAAEQARITGAEHSVILLEWIEKSDK